MRPASRLLGCVLSALLGSSCSRPTAQVREPSGAPIGPPTSAAQPTASLTGAAPQLVVALIYDQLGSDTLLEHLDWLDPKGAIRQAIERGIFLERSVYPYANTLTAPGHVTIHTGVLPSQSGIDGNSTWDASKAQAVAAIDDPPHLVFGREAESASAGPARLRVATVADALKAHTRGAAKVISLSLKDRSAILSVGKGADLVLWYDAKLGVFTSSSAWGSALPAWLAAYQARHALSELLTPWAALWPERYLARLGPDDAPGEGDLGGFGTTFPHLFDKVDRPLQLLSCTPMLSEYLVALTDAAVRESGLGRDAVPDLVALSISGTDCAGHVFGPGSWEYVDHLVRADRAAGAWLERLEREMSIAVLITSDHGVARLPEREAAPAGRVFPEQIRDRLEAALSAELGAGPWVAGVLSPFVYLTARAHRRPDAASVLDRALRIMLAEVGMRAVWPLSSVRAFAHGTDPLLRSLSASVTPDNSADLMFLTLPNYPLDLRDPLAKGTNHGTPYDYDRQVPVLAWGAAVPHRRQAEPVDQLQVAATLAHLLGVPGPATAEPQPLF